MNEFNLLRPVKDIDFNYYEDGRQTNLSNLQASLDFENTVGTLAAQKGFKFSRFGRDYNESNFTLSKDITVEDINKVLKGVTDFKAEKLMTDIQLIPYRMSLRNPIKMASGLLIDTPQNILPYKISKVMSSGHQKNNNFFECLDIFIIGKLFEKHNVTAPIETLHKEAVLHMSTCSFFDVNHTPKPLG